ncbi:MAG: cobalt-zinc-cadmium efflux system protein, partial [Candidatus Azotimanducaceae bacterium]
MSEHSHNHSHAHAHPDLKGKKLLLSIFLNIAITVAQVIGGLISGSLSLLSDALHNFSDVLSLIVSYVADLYSKKEASPERTFGYKRAEIIAAFVNALSLIIVAICLVYEAIHRFFDPQKIDSSIVIWLALLGILANGFSVLLLHKDSKSNMNMRSAYLHLMTDMAASVAVLVGGLLMKYLGWFWVDSVLTVLIAIYLVIMGYKLLKESFKVLMLFTPENL